MSEPANNPEPIPLLPYAGKSPRAERGDLFRDGSTLVVRDGVRLREVCVLCGEPGCGEPLRLKFSWDSSFQVAKATTLELRQGGSVYAWLCQGHLRRWRRGRVAGVVGMAGSAAVMAASVVVAVISESSEIPRYSPPAIGGLLAGFAMFIGFLFLFTLRTRTLRCRRIEGGYLYLEGAGEGFLEGLAGLPGGGE